MKMFQKKLESEKWAWPHICLNCGWERSSKDKWTIVNAMFPPMQCPKCKGRLSLRKPSCPKCDKILSKFRFPKNIKMAFLGGHYCKQCHIEIDKWGKEIKKLGVPEDIYRAERQIEADETIPHLQAKANILKRFK